jgi:hypothetical protein
MEFIPQSLFDSIVGQTFLVEVIYRPQFKKTAESYGFTDTIQLDNIFTYPNTINSYVKTMVCGGSVSFKMPSKETVVEEFINPTTGQLDKRLADLDQAIDMEIESDGKLLDDYKKKIGKLNDKLTNLKDSLTSIIASTTSYVTAVAIPFSMAAGIAGIMSTIGQLKGLKNIIGDVNELLEECNLSAENLDSLVPGVGTTITALLDLIEGTVTVLTAIIPV